MDASGSSDANRQYYDAFSADYERERGNNDPGGYHELLDELEASYVRRFGQGKDVLEVGCGTGLVLLRLREFAHRATGVDLSPGMLEKAQQRGLDVKLGSATELPFESDQFDDARLEYTLTTTDGNRFVFDARTGAMLSKFRPAFARPARRRSGWRQSSVWA